MVNVYSAPGFLWKHPRMDRRFWRFVLMFSTSLTCPTDFGYLLWSPKYVELALSVSESTQGDQYGGGMLSGYVQDTSQKRTWSQVKPQLHQLKGDILQMVERRKLLHRRKTRNQAMRRQQFKGNVETLGCQLVTSMARIGREGLHAQRNLHLPNRRKDTHWTLTGNRESS